MRDFDRSAQAYVDAGIPLGEYYTEYADAMIDLRLLPEASAAAARAVEELDAAGLRCMATEAQMRLARISLLTGDLGTGRRARGRGRRRGPTAAARVAPATTRSSSGSRRGCSGAGRPGGARRRASGRGAARAGREPAQRGRGVPGGGAGGARQSTGRATPCRRLSRAGGLARTGQVLVRLRGRLAGALAARVAQRPSAALVRVPRRPARPRASTGRACPRSSCARWRRGTAPSSARSGWASSWTGARRPGRWRGWNAPGRRHC